MNTEIKEIEINGVKYVEKSSIKLESASDLNGLPYKLIRSNRAGVFVGYLEEEKGDVVILKEARRLWYWTGAASLSQLAIDGVSKPLNCKFPATVKKIKIFGVIEILEVTEKAKKSIEGVSIWQV